MRVLNAVTIAALAIGSGALAVGNASAQAAPCPERMTFVVGGALDSDANAFNNTSGPMTRVGYPASVWPHGPVDHDESIKQGRANLRRAMLDFHNACPESQITAAGYSLGSEVVGDELEQIGADGSIPADRINGVLYSDPRQAGGIATVIPGVIPGLTMRGERSGFGGIQVNQVCLKGDAICDMRNPFVNPIGAIDSAIGYWTKHPTYSIDPARDAGSGTTVIDAPPSLPVPAELAYADAPIVPTPQEVLQPIVQPVLDLLPVLDATTVWLPPAPSPVYIPTPVSAYIPPQVAAILPPVVRDHILPPLPTFGGF